MDNQISFIEREKRFEVSDLSGFDAIVRRVGADEESVFFAELVDFSRTGVKFNLPFCGRFDEQLDVRFEFKNSDLYYQGSGRVRHLRSVGENRWQVGCSIDPPLPEEVISHLASSTNQERRRSSRVDVREVGQVQRQGSIEACEATLLNISEGGFCLQVDREHEISERIDFIIKNKNGEDEIIAARIRWQNSTDEGFRLGCGFADSDSYDKLVDCLTSAHGSATESLSWLVIAAALLAMIVPPVTYFMFGTTTEKQIADVIEPEIVTERSENDVPENSQVFTQPIDTLVDESTETETQESSDASEAQEPLEPVTLASDEPPTKGIDDQEMQTVKTDPQTQEPENNLPVIDSNETKVVSDEQETVPDSLVATTARDSTAPVAGDPNAPTTRRPVGAEPVPAVTVPGFESVAQSPANSALPPVSLRTVKQKFQTVLKVNHATASTRRIQSKRPLFVPYETIDK